MCEFGFLSQNFLFLTQNRTYIVSLNFLTSKLLNTKDAL